MPGPKITDRTAGATTTLPTTLTPLASVGLEEMASTTACPLDTMTTPDTSPTTCRVENAVWLT